MTALLVAGCASETVMKESRGILNFTNDTDTARLREPLEKIPDGLGIRVAAETWPALVEKVKPAFAWNGCDLMWIE